MNKEKNSDQIQIRELSDINDAFVDLKVRQPYIYNILNIYNGYICHYIQSVFNDKCSSSSTLLKKKGYCMCFERKDINDHVTNKGKESLLSDEYIDSIADLFPSLDIELERDKFKDWKRAKGVRHKDSRAAFRNWLRKGVELQARYGEVKKTVRKYEDLFPDEEE